MYGQIEPSGKFLRTSHLTKLSVLTMLNGEELDAASRCGGALAVATRRRDCEIFPIKHGCYFDIIRRQCIRAE